MLFKTQSIEVVEELYKNGADLNTTDTNGFTFIDYWMMYCKPTLEEFKSFVGWGVDIHRKNDLGELPIINAAAFDLTDIFCWMVDQGIALDQTTFEGETLLEFVSENRKMIKKMWEHQEKLHPKDKAKIEKDKLRYILT